MDMMMYVVTTSLDNIPALVKNENRVFGVYSSIYKAKDAILEFAKNSHNKYTIQDDNGMRMVVRNEWMIRDFDFNIVAVEMNEMIEGF